MPTYDYVCEACQHEFEHFQPMMDEPLKKCPECGRRKLRRLIGPGAAIVFKGSGFYQTDYRSESYKKSAAAEKSKATSESKTPSTAADGAKSEAKGKEKKASKSSGTEGREKRGEG